jgi:hypothetical protein|tara:strand:+ start:562 stop:705 length:144 start_codon:yes stop_codon:yes gene_type:complete
LGKRAKRKEKGVLNFQKETLMATKYVLFIGICPDEGQKLSTPRMLES